MSSETNPLILIVDDEESIRSVCRRVLAPHGYVVETAANADEALGVLKEKSIDLVVTDLAMPGSMNGAKLLDHIHSHWPKTAVMMMTAFPNLESAVGTLRGGAVDYLVKPFNREQLVEAVAQALKAHRPGSAGTGKT